MKLVWKLLRQHISLPQFAGFFFASLVGMLIILLGNQFHVDTQAIYTGKDALMKSDYIIVNKKVGAVTSLMGRSNGFSTDEIEDLERQSFVNKMGWFTPSAFDVSAGFDIQGMTRLSTDMFFESVPDEFVDVKTNEWTFNPEEKRIPIIVPRNYLDLYNFGYAQSRSLPKLSEGIIGALALRISIRGNGGVDNYTGKIVGFSSRLNTILVPQSFMEWANNHYAPHAEKEPTRLIIEVDNPTDSSIAEFLNSRNYLTDETKLDASKASYVFRFVTAIVMLVGLVICVLAFYILMLSVYLLVEKNSTKVENLLLLGYTPRRVALPYQVLAFVLNVVVLLLAIALLYLIRCAYIGSLTDFFPSMEVPSMMPTIELGCVCCFMASAMTYFTIRNKMFSMAR